MKNSIFYNNSLNCNSLIFQLIKKGRKGINYERKKYEKKKKGLAIGKSDFKEIITRIMGKKLKWSLK